MQFKSFMEALKGKQHKIDKNKNGQIDAQDFKLLRKEESEESDETIEESEVRLTRADYKVGPSGRKSHKEIVFADAESKEDEDDKKDMKEAKMSDADMAERERIVKGMKKNLAGFKARYGDRAKEVMYATATKQAMKEDVEQLDELSPNTLKSYIKRAKENKKFEADTQNTAMRKDDHMMASDSAEKVAKRKQGIKDAKAKLNKEEVEELDEISLQTMQSAKDKLGRRAFDANMDDNKYGAQHYAARAMEMSKKIKQKERQVTKEEVEQIEEGGQSYGSERPAFKVDTTVGKPKLTGRNVPVVQKVPGKEIDLSKLPNARLKSEEVQKADIPAYLRKQQGQTPLKLSDLKRKDTISDKENLAKLRNEELELEEATKYVVHYTNDKGEHVNSSKSFDDKAKADAHASKGNAMDKVGGKYTVKSMQNEAKKDDVPFEGPYTKVPANVKDKSGAVHTPMSRAKDLARQAMKQKMKEDFDIEMTDDQADSILQYVDEQAPVAPVPDKKYIKGTPEHKAYKATKKPINGHPTNVKEQVELDEVESKTLSYTDFISTLLEYETKDGRYVHKGTYGGAYVDPEGADDADDKKPKKQPAEKRGRGRPAGAKSGAGKITGTSKLYK